jgi:hypothetical protein
MNSSLCAAQAKSLDVVIGVDWLHQGIAPPQGMARIRDTVGLAGYTE